MPYNSKLIFRIRRGRRLPAQFPPQFAGTLDPARFDKFVNFLRVKSDMPTDKDRRQQPALTPVDDGLGREPEADRNWKRPDQFVSYFSHVQVSLVLIYAISRKLWVTPFR